MKREPGYYWVKWKSEQVWDLAMWIENRNWSIGELGYWIITGTLSKFKDKDFQEVNETRIKNPDEK